MRLPPPTAPHPHHGFSLIEVLITLLIVSIGLLGIALLQVKMLKLNQDAFFQASVAQAVDRLNEDIRTNINLQTINHRDQLTLSHYAQTNASFSSSASTISGCNSLNNACAMEATARYQLNVFKSRLEAQLGGNTRVRAIVCLDAANAGEPTFDNPNCTGSGQLFIKVVWRQRFSTAGDDPVSAIYVQRVDI